MTHFSVQIANNKNSFSFTDVASYITGKLISSLKKYWANFNIFMTDTL